MIAILVKLHPLYLTARCIRANTVVKRLRQQLVEKEQNEQKHKQQLLQKDEELTKNKQQMREKDEEFTKNKREKEEELAKKDDIIVRPNAT